MPFVLEILLFSRPWCYRSRRSRIAEQLFAHFIHADLRILRVVSPDIDGQHIFHASDKLRIGFRSDTPLLFEPGLEFVFFSTCRTVSWLTASTSPTLTSLCANKRKLHRPSPSGFSPHVKAIRWASFSPSRMRLSGRSGWGRRLSASSSPWSTKR